VILNGTYTCQDSDPASWSQNPQTGGKGFCIVYVTNVVKKDRRDDHDDEDDDHEEDDDDSCQEEQQARDQGDAGLREPAAHGDVRALLTEGRAVACRLR